MAATNMIRALTFFFSHLSRFQLLLLGTALSIHVRALYLSLEAEKVLATSISKVVSTPDVLYAHLLGIAYHLTIYAASMLVIDVLGRVAVRNAMTTTISQLLHAHLPSYTQKDYERLCLSVGEHGDNVANSVKNLFIELPKKVVTTLHFVLALRDLSTSVMVYCVGASAILLVLTSCISILRKALSERITNHRVSFNIVCADISSSIQQYKIDEQLERRMRAARTLLDGTLHLVGMDSVATCSCEAMTSLSSQLMIALIATSCSGIEARIDDLLYGIRSSAKFVEKLVGIFEYTADVVRQYQSYSFFLSRVEVELPTQADDSDCLHIETTIEKHLIHKSHGNYIVITGSNGAGKTTMLLKALDVAYNGSSSRGRILEKLDRRQVAFVAQAVPCTQDTVEEYTAAVDYATRHTYLAKLDTTKRMKELSGGQAKLVQIVTAYAKVRLNDRCIFMLDEPSNNLDAETVDSVIELLRDCYHDGTTVIVITHDSRLVIPEANVVTL
jgi:ABC-type lipoprotein export system ATPase subunit